MNRTSRVADSLVGRLTHGHENHGQRWHLHLPREGQSAADVRPLLVLLGLPTFGLAFAISVLTTYGPVILIHLAHSPTAVGALIGGEGAFALVVPLASGAISDRLPPSAFGRRLPFVLLGVPLAGAGLVLLPFSSTIGIAGAAVLTFFVGYYVYYPPYRALYADLLPRRLYARAQAGQAIARGAGLGIALLAGGLLLGLWQPLPFLIAASVLAATTIALLPVFRLQSRCDSSTLPYTPAPLLAIVLQSRDLRRFGVVNALWEFSFAGLKSFVVLYVVRGLGRSPAVASAVIAVVAVAYIVGAPLAGRLADRYGIVRVLRLTSLVYGAGLVIGVLPHTLPPLLIGLPVVALAGAIVLTLPQALAFTLAPAGNEGAAAGLQDFSRGLGVVLGHDRGRRSGRRLTAGVRVDARVCQHVAGHRPTCAARRIPPQTAGQKEDDMTDATLLTDRARPAVRLERISPTHPRSSGRRSPTASSFGPGFSLAGLEPAHYAWQTQFERYAAAFEPSLGPQERLPAGYKGGERREET